MVMLALDTATSRTDVALVDGEQVVAHLHVDGAMAHGEALGALVASAFADSGLRAADLHAVAVGTGPGPFTGLRVGLAFARTMAWSRSIPVHGICTLDVVAAAAEVEEDFLVLTDARRKEVYWAQYVDRVRVDGPHVSKPAQVVAMCGDRLVVGEGACTYADLFPHAQAPLYPSAVDLALLAQRYGAAGVPMPVDAHYLRAPDVTV